MQIKMDLTIPSAKQKKQTEKKGKFFELAENEKV